MTFFRFVFVFLRLPCPVIPVRKPKEEAFDSYVLVCENLEWDNPTWAFLKEPIQKAAKVLSIANSVHDLHACLFWIRLIDSNTAFILVTPFLRLAYSQY